ncbi:MAG: short-chain dehydrogenase [Vicingaceae bacterium]|nr:MAG: short-chain dehydrogenase [Vicingaceae bacterium]
MHTNAILITGVSSGIGLSLAKQISAQQIPLIGITSDIKKATLQWEKNGIPVNSTDSLLIEADISSAELKHKIETLLPQNIRIRHIICNSAIMIKKNFFEFTRDDFQHTYQTNVWSIINTIQSCFPFLSFPSTVTLIGSMGGIPFTQKFKDLTLYSSSKGAVTVLTELLAQDLKEHHINVNCLALGSVDTPMFRQTFPGYQAQYTPDQIAQFIIHFISHHAPLVSGQIITITKSTI